MTSVVMCDNVLLVMVSIINMTGVDVCDNVLSLQVLVWRVWLESRCHGTVCLVTLSTRHPDWRHRDKVSNKTTKFNTTIISSQILQ